ncbi:transcription initiation factor TFIID subunit 4-like isoform X2 [Phocoena sinus]|nr:transcription initiation factor TFIID subunit 4-like isoform X2 [Phocoena sinus]
MATLEWQSWRAHPPGAAARDSGKTPVCVQAAAHSSLTSWPPHPSRRTQVPMDLVQPSITIPPLSVSDGPVPSCAAASSSQKPAPGSRPPSGLHTLVATPVHTASSNPHQSQGSLPVRLAPGANLGPKVCSHPRHPAKATLFTPTAACCLFRVDSWPQQNCASARQRRGLPAAISPPQAPNCPGSWLVGFQVHRGVSNCSPPPNLRAPCSPLANHLTVDQRPRSDNAPSVPSQASPKPKHSVQKAPGTFWPLPSPPAPPPWGSHLIPPPSQT